MQLKRSQDEEGKALRRRKYIALNTAGVHTLHLTVVHSLETVARHFPVVTFEMVYLQLLPGDSQSWRVRSRLRLVLSNNAASSSSSSHGSNVDNSKHSPGNSEVHNNSDSRARKGRAQRLCPRERLC